MRHDLGKILTEKGKARSRWDGGKQNRRQNRERKSDDLPSHQGMSAKYLPGWGHSSDYTKNPLRKMILGAVGRPWDKVYGEIRAVINKDNHSQSSALDSFLRYDIERNVKEIVKIGKIKVPHDVEGHPIYNKVWVHPQTGIIMKPVKRPAQPAREPRPPKYIKVDGRFFRVFFPEAPKDLPLSVDYDYGEGNWFEVEFQKITGHEEGLSNLNVKFIADDGQFPVRDAIYGTFVDAQAAKNIHGSYIFATKKRQLSKGEIKKFKLAGKFAGVKPNDESQRRRP